MAPYSLLEFTSHANHTLHYAVACHHQHQHATVYRVCHVYYSLLADCPNPTHLQQAQGVLNAGLVALHAPEYAAKHQRAEHARQFSHSGSQLISRHLPPRPLQLQQHLPEVSHARDGGWCWREACVPQLGRAGRASLAAPSSSKLSDTLVTSRLLFRAGVLDGDEISQKSPQGCSWQDNCA